MSETKLTSWQVLRNKFPAEEYVLLAEVSDASGFSRSRSLDYMLVNLWQSRGLAITGIEKKSHRSDWLKELKTPAKQENHFKHCDYFYLLTDRENVAKIEEIPISWGWYHITEKGILKTMKSAPKLDSTPVGRSLLCAMLRRAADKTGFVHKDSIADKIAEAKALGEQSKGYHEERMKTQLIELQKHVREFEEAAGVKFGSWGPYDPKNIGKVVRFFEEGDVEGLKKKLLDLKKTSDFINSSIEEHIQHLTV